MTSTKAPHNKAELDGKLTFSSYMLSTSCMTFMVAQILDIPPTIRILNINDYVKMIFEVTATVLAVFSSTFAYLEEISKGRVAVKEVLSLDASS